MWNKYFDSGLTFDAISEFFDVALCLFNAYCAFYQYFAPFRPGSGENLLKKVIESRYIGHFLINGQIIVIDFTLP